MNATRIQVAIVLADLIGTLPTTGCLAFAPRPNAPFLIADDLVRAGSLSFPIF